MDRPIVKEKKPVKKYAIWAVLLCVVTYSGYAFISSDFSSIRVSKDSIRSGTVARGEFAVSILGNGTVVPDDVDMVLPKASGEVVSVEVKSGDWVEEGQLLFVFTNEELTEDASKMELLYAESRSSLSSKKFELDSEEMSFQSAVLTAESDYKFIYEEHQAHEELRKNGDSPISELEYRQTSIKTKQLYKQYELAKTRLANFQQSKEVQLNEYEARVAVAKRNMERLQQKVENMNLRAKRAGLIQDVELKPGQRVELGNILAEISNPNDVLIRLKVAALQAHKLSIGMPATIKVNSDHFSGVVERIDPNVKGTTLDVDVKLVDEVSNLRANMFVSGEVHVQKLDNVLYVGKPNGVVENGHSLIYVINENGKVAELKRVKTGLSSGSAIQIINGLNEGDKVILSDLSRVNGAKSLIIN